MAHRRTRAATVYDVARRAEVSSATVSRVMRNTAPVAESTRTRVQRAIAELSFIPSRLGVSLAEGRHVADGIVFPSLSGPYFAEVVLGYEEEAGLLERPVILVSTRGRTAARARVLDLASRVDGLVVLG
ncbi:MAG TPA: LacI family DNA-binding transcriptional regulator, partial [Actinomycetales bacterium]|nr:LacI family DNA-binding transcriptional regulator [Actinomycetales bacterium]